MTCIDHAGVERTRQPNCMLYMRSQMHPCIHAYTHTPTYTHAHTQTHSSGPPVNPSEEDLVKPHRTVSSEVADVVILGEYLTGQIIESETYPQQVLSQVFLHLFFFFQLR